ncbi:MAG: HAD-IIIA family hydrolase [Bacteroidetes bacterium]|nr:HAD-IIIA family hydrolase [Bacteroidota bacterium]
MAARLHKALFLDRDGVVNEDNPGYTWRKADFQYTPFIFPLTQAATRLGYKLVLVTNQGGIGKGLYGRTEVEQLHMQMQADFAAQGIAWHRILYCPHHPSTSNCLCRKPGSLLFERAVALEQIDPLQSWMIGDRCRDIIPARKLGLRTLILGADECAQAHLRLLPPFDAEDILKLMQA